MPQRSEPSNLQRLSGAAEAVLWTAPAALDTDDGAAGARTALIERNMAFARMLAAKLYGARTLIEHEFGDYFQLALLGLIEAAEHFDPKRGVPFEAYASRRITGSVLNGVRTLTEKQQQISTRQAVLRERRKSIQNNMPDSAGSGDALGQLAEIAIGLAIGIALEDSGMFSASEGVVSAGPYEQLEWKQLCLRLRESVEKLARVEREVVRQHYFYFRSFADIADELEISRGRVSQIHRRALKALEVVLATKRKPLDARV